MVEYSEPADVPFPGHFTIAEVNHDYRDIFRREPSTDASKFACMPDVLCSAAANAAIRSTVLLFINGNTACTGSLLNNTADDGTPYLLTAVHCFVDNDTIPFPLDKASYTAKAGTIIAFFNYNRPVCDVNIKMKGSEGMSLAGATPQVIVARKDIALFKLKDSPPDYFNTYYSGWNNALTSSGNHTNLHHPLAAVKKYGMTNQNVNVVSWPDATILDANSHWKIPSWTTGSTDNGSSGSPLFDENQLVIGALSGGNSTCAGTGVQTDYFSILGKGWETGDLTNQLKTYLDPENKGVTQYQGKDPNKANPVVRLANAQYTNGDLLVVDSLTSPNQGKVFGNSNLQTIEFAEEFNVPNPVQIFGTYLLIPAMPFSYTSGVKISVYTGNSAPTTKIDSAFFIPKFQEYSSSSGFYQTNVNTGTAPTESFGLFDKPV
jgi:hypothetical protein